MQIKTTMGYNYTPIRMAKKTKWYYLGPMSLQSNYDSQVLLVRMPNGTTTKESSLALSCKFKHTLIYDPEVPLLGIHPTELKLTCTQNTGHEHLWQNNL